MKAEDYERRLLKRHAQSCPRKAKYKFILQTREKILEYRSQGIFTEAYYCYNCGYYHIGKVRKSLRKKLQQAAGPAGPAVNQ